MDDEERKRKHREYMREYYLRNPAKAVAKRAQVKAKRNINPAWADAQRRRSREYAAKDVQRSRDRATAWRLANPERYKENMRRAHERNREKRVAAAAAWKKANPEKAKAAAIDHAHRRRAKKLEGDYAGCASLIAKWKQQVRFICHICGHRFQTKGNMHVDHIIPLSKGGGHVIENLQRLCSGCNLRKSDKLDYAS